MRISKAHQRERRVAQRNATEDALQCVQIRQQIADLLVCQHVRKAFHFVAAHPDDISGPIVIRRHTAPSEVLALEYAFQTRALAFS